MNLSASPFHQRPRGQRLPFDELSTRIVCTTHFILLLGEVYPKYEDEFESATLLFISKFHQKCTAFQLMTRHVVKHDHERTLLPA
jgi:hypothetical protein